jgi:hypothetical protein
VQAAPSVEPPATHPSADPRAVVESGVRAALQRYAEAYNAMDVEQVRAVFPSFNRLRELEQSFKALRSYNMVVTPGPIQLADDLSTATVPCEISGSYVPLVGNSGQLPRTKKTFSLQRRDAGWIITRVDP